MQINALYTDSKKSKRKERKECHTAWSFGLYSGVSKSNRYQYTGA